MFDTIGYGGVVYTWSRVGVGVGLGWRVRVCGRTDGGPGRRCDAGHDWAGCAICRWLGVRVQAALWDMCTGEWVVRGTYSTRCPIVMCKQLVRDRVTYTSDAFATIRT